MVDMHTGHLPPDTPKRTFADTFESVYASSEEARRTASRSQLHSPVEGVLPKVPQDTGVDLSLSLGSQSLGRIFASFASLQSASEKLEALMEDLWANGDEIKRIESSLTPFEQSAPRFLVRLFSGRLAELDLLKDLGKRQERIEQEGLEAKTFFHAQTNNVVKVICAELNEIAPQFKLLSELINLAERIQHRFVSARDSLSKVPELSDVRLQFELAKEDVEQYLHALGGLEDELIKSQNAQNLIDPFIGNGYQDVLLRALNVVREPVTALPGTSLAIVRVLEGRIQSLEDFQERFTKILAELNKINPIKTAYADWIKKLYEYSKARYEKFGNGG